MYQSAVVEYASANHATFSREEKLSKPLPRATFPCSGTVFYPLEMQKTLFYMRPEVVLPMCNRCLVALTRAPLGLLITPAHAASEMPQRIGVVANTKFFPDYCGAAL